MNIASIKWPQFNPYNKPTVEIYVAGCYNGCKNCVLPNSKIKTKNGQIFAKNIKINDVLDLRFAKTIVKNKINVIDDALEIEFDNGKRIIVGKTHKFLKNLNCEIINAEQLCVGSIIYG